MKQLCLAAALLIPLLPAAGRNPFAGRWDLTITGANATYPGWMEFSDASGAPQVRVQPRSGSVRPATNVKLNGSHLTLTVTPAGDNRPEVTWDLTVQGDQITGTQKRGGAEPARVAGIEASGTESLDGGRAALQWQGSVGLGAVRVRGKSLGRAKRRTGERGERREPPDDA